MAFTVEDFHDLIKLLAERPEWRAELRRHVLSDELLELPSLVRQLVEAQARAEARLERVESRLEGVESRLERVEARLDGLETAMQALVEAQARTDERMAELAAAQARTDERIGELAAAQVRVEAQVRALVEAQARTDERMAELAAAQARTEAQVRALAEAQALSEARLGRVEDKVGRLDGRMLEVEFARNAMAYLGSVVRRARVVDKSALADLLDDAIDEGRFTQTERQAVLLADLVLSGSRRSDDRDVYVLAEVSVGIGPYDVERAADRAALLERLGRPVLPLVAGEQINPEAQAMAQNRGVQYVRVG